MVSHVMGKLTDDVFMSTWKGTTVKSAGLIMGRHKQCTLSMTTRSCCHKIFQFIIQNFHIYKLFQQSVASYVPPRLPWCTAAHDCSLPTSMIQCSERPFFRDRPSHHHTGSVIHCNSSMAVSAMKTFQSDRLCSQQHCHLTRPCQAVCGMHCHMTMEDGKIIAEQCAPSMQQ